MRPLISIWKTLLVILSLAQLSALYAAETVFVPKNSLLFKDEKGENNWEIKAAARDDFFGEVIKKEKVFLNQGNVIGVYVEVCHLKIPGTDGLCYFPGVRFNKGGDGRIIPNVDRIDSLMFLGVLILAIGIAALTGYFHLKTEKKNYLLPAVLLCFFWGYSLWLIGYLSDSFMIPTDEISYFDIAKKLLAWDFTSKQYAFTIGFPVLCTPFILLFHSQNCLEFIYVYTYFQTFILIPGFFLVVYRFFYKKMDMSRIQSFCILFLWLFLIVFYYPIYGSTGPVFPYIPETFLSNANFSLFEAKNDLIFTQFTWLGRNAMSDYAAVFLLIVLLYVSMQKSRSLIRFSLLSMGFGFLCLVRINYIFFAPLLAFVFYDSFSALWNDKRNYLYAALCGTVGFMIVFVWQFIINDIQFGSPFVWPYSLHKFAPDRGFVLNVIPYGFKFLCQNNYIYMILGISSWFFIPERKKRVLLALWIFPVLLFFTGYPIVFNNPMRFIFALYPPLLAALVSNPVWQSPRTVRIKALLVMICSCLLCKSNIFFLPYQPWNLGKYGISNNSFILVQTIVCLFCCAVIVSMRKELRADYANTIRHFRFLIVFTSVFFLGSVCIYIAGLLVLAALVYGLHDTFAEIRQIWEKNAVHVTACQ